MISQKNLKASLVKYLYENLDSSSVEILESIYLDDPSGYDKWVAIQFLTNNMGVQPKQLVFLHCAVKGMFEESFEELDGLVDTVYGLVTDGTRFGAYEYPTGDLVGTIGEIEVTKPSLGPVQQHSSGGIKRVVSLGLLYEGD